MSRDSQENRPPSDGPLIVGLMNPAAYPHAVTSVQLIETHISWLLLTGAVAYKIKKPVNFGFVDFSDLARRKHYCEEELRLNRRFAPELYRRVVPILGTPRQPRVGEHGEGIEYAVEMTQFSQEARLDRVLARGELSPLLCDALAESIAAAHRMTAVADETGPYGQPAAVEQQILDTLSLAQRADAERAAGIRRWCEREFERLQPVLEQRRQSGFVRECHGDLHLENMVLVGRRVVLFDCLEFNPNLRWIDVMSDLAFITMDLADRGHPPLANRLLNRYLELSGDYPGLAVLRYFQVYRAAVRAAVATLRLQQTAVADQRRAALGRQANDYLKLAESLTRDARPFLAITYGLSGSGKSTGTQSLLEALAALRLRSDVERRRVEAAQGMRGAADRYSAAARRRVYQRLCSMADQVLAAGFPVIIDATFLKRSDRELFYALAKRRHVPLIVLTFHAADDELRRRLAGRSARPDEASEATAAVLDQQRREVEPLGDDERRALAVFEASAMSTADLAAQIADHLR